MRIDLRISLIGGAVIGAVIGVVLAALTNEGKSVAKHPDGRDEQPKISCSGDVEINGKRVKGDILSVGTISLINAACSGWVVARGNVEASDCDDLKSVKADGFVRLYRCIVQSIITESVYLVDSEILENITAKYLEQMQNSTIHGTLTCMTLSKPIFLENCTITTIYVKDELDTGRSNFISIKGSVITGDIVQGTVVKVEGPGSVAVGSGRGSSYVAQASGSGSVAVAGSLRGKIITSRDGAMVQMEVSETGPVLYLYNSKVDTVCFQGARLGKVILSGDSAIGSVVNGVTEID